MKDGRKAGFYEAIEQRLAIVAKTEVSRWPFDSVRRVGPDEGHCRRESLRADAIELQAPRFRPSRGEDLKSESSDVRSDDLKSVSMWSSGFLVDSSVDDM
jgi:hypothetical protein